MFFYPRLNENKSAKRCLRINLREDPCSLDPRRGKNMSGASHVHAMLFEGLMRLEPDGSLSCAQAHAYEVSPDGRTYTFYLGRTLWSDGTPVTAEDFEKTWKKILDPLFNCRDTHILFCVKNAKAAKQGTLSLDAVGIFAKDAKTLVIELERATPQFLQIAASCALFPVHRAQDQLFARWHLEVSEHFLCNGPFKLVFWAHNQEMLLEKNRHYHRANKIKLDAVHLSMITDGIVPLHIDASGLFDVIGLPLSPLPVDLCRELANNDLLHIAETAGTAMCMFNTKQFPFHNVNMRKAFCYALNRRHLVNTATLLREKPALGYIPPILKNNQTRRFFKDNDAKNANVHFRKGLEELNITVDDLHNKITFSFWKQDHGCPLLAQILQQQWLERFGVEVALEALDFATLHEKGKNGDFSIGYFVHLSLYCDSIDLLERFYDTHNARNYTRWENATYRALLDRQRESPATSREQAEEILMKEMPCAPLFYWNNALLVQPCVKGLAISPLGYLCFERISFDFSRKTIRKGS